MNGRQAFDEDLGPEKAVDLESKIGQLSWSKKPDLIDARVYQLPSTIGATYFYRKLQAASERTIELSFGSDDAIKVLVNGKQVLSNFASRAAAPDQERVEVNLKQGENELLVKIVNTGGISGLYFNKINESAAGLPAGVVASLRTPAKTRTTEQRKEIRTHFRSQHSPDWKSLARERDQLRKRS